MSDPKPGTSQESALQNNLPNPPNSNPSFEAVDTVHCALLPADLVQGYASKAHSEGNLDQESKIFPVQKSRSKKHLDKRKNKPHQKYVTSSSSLEESEISVQVKKSYKSRGILLSHTSQNLTPNQNLTQTLCFT